MNVSVDAYPFLAFSDLTCHLEDFNTLLKRVTKTNKNETKEQKGGILGMLLGDLGASLLGNMLAETGMFRAGPSYPLTDFEIQNNYQNES